MNNGFNPLPRLRWCNGLAEVTAMVGLSIG